MSALTKTPENLVLSSKDREIELINEEVLRKRKEKVLNTQIWLIHNVKVI